MISISGMWSTSFYFGNFVGPTAAGFLVQDHGFRATTVLFFGLYVIFFFVDIGELIFNMRKNGWNGRIWKEMKEKY